MKSFLFLLVVVLLFSMASCMPNSGGQQTLNVMVHDSFSVSEDVIKAFESENDVSVSFIKSGDTGAALNRVILTKKNPQADVFYGVDNTFLSRAIDAGIFESYSSPSLEKIPGDFMAGIEGQVTPIDYGDVCINYDRRYFVDHKLEVPSSLADLLKPEYGAFGGKEGLLVIENPATSSPGLAFLLATIAEYGESGYLDYWKSLKANGVVVVNDWETAYYTNFSASSGKGLQPMVLSYATSPAAEVFYASEALTESPTASIVGRNTCFRQVEYAGILKSTHNRKLAQKFIDYMLSLSFQEDIPLQMFVYPVNPEAALPVEFIKFVQVPDQPASLDPKLISQRRDAWINAWNEIMLP